MKEKVLCFLARHKWQRYKSSSSGNPIRICRYCDKKEEAYYDLLSWSWDEPGKLDKKKED